jgi:hypothetical protein
MHNFEPYEMMTFQHLKIKYETVPKTETKSLLVLSQLFVKYVSYTFSTMPKETRFMFSNFHTSKCNLLHERT